MCPTFPVSASPAPRERLTEQLLRQGIAFHIKGMLADGDLIPEPTTRVVRMPISA